MKSLTHGILPTEVAFADAYEVEIGDVTYGMSLNLSDQAMIEACGLSSLFTNPNGYRVGHMAPYRTEFTCSQLYALVEALAAANTDERLFMTNNDAANWAGDFASSILATLGFEWV